MTARSRGSSGAVNFSTATRTDIDCATALTDAGTVTLEATTISGVDVTTVGGNIECAGAVELNTRAVQLKTDDSQAGTLTPLTARKISL